MFEFLRKFSLLMLLFVVGLSTYLSAQNATDWQETLWIKVYPINGDGLETTAGYITRLRDSDFASIERFMAREAKRYAVDIENPVRMLIGEQLSEKPPKPPFETNFLRIGLWSLEMRWWTHQQTAHLGGPDPDIKLFLVYYDPAQTPALEHSVGLQKGRVGIVNVFAAEDMAATNNFVIAHEMMHTLGATDKYGPPHMLPVFPEGYGEPDKTPLYPQTVAELMGGRIVISESQTAMPDGLREARVGPETALEIRWIE